MNENMQPPSKTLSASLADLADLADGRATEQQLDALLRQWSEDEGLRRDWAALHLGGEALRSPELAAPVQSSEALLARLRERIAAEPVVLRPLQSGRAAGRARDARDASRWLPPVGVAAGFILLALIAPRLFMPLAPSAHPAGSPFVPPFAPPGAHSDSSQDLTGALVVVPGSGALDPTSSFVQTIVAPDQPGQVSPQAVQASERLLSLPPPYSATSAPSTPANAAVMP